MSGKSKILEEIHPLQLIREVEKRPVLYVRNIPEMADSRFRLKIWSEVGQSLFPDWQSLSEQSKEIKVTNLMKKWRNLRDTFKRQVEIQKKILAGHMIKKKVYVYFKHMSFLLPHCQEDDSIIVSEPKSLPVPKKGFKRKIISPTKQAVREASFPNPVFAEDIDEDKHFLMSLIPSFRRMTEEEKLTAKMEILKVIKNVKTSSTPEVDGISFHEVDSLTTDANLMDIKIEASTDLCQINADLESETDPDMDSE